MTKSRFSELSRRDVMVMVPAAAAVAGLGGRAALASGSFGASHGHQVRFVLAYLAGSESWDHLDAISPTLEAVTEEMEVETAPLVAADRLSQGDTDFIDRSARITVHGLLAEPVGDLPAVSLNAHYRPFHDVPHTVWAFDGGPSCGAGCGLTVPVHPDHGVDLSLVVRPQGSDSAEARVLLAVGDRPGQAKLRRGAYLLAWDAPDGRLSPADWAGLQAVVETIPEPEEDMPATRRFMLTAGGGEARPVALPALLLTVDYDDQGRTVTA